MTTLPAATVTFSQSNGASDVSCVIDQSVYVGDPANFDNCELVTTAPGAWTIRALTDGHGFVATLAGSSEASIAWQEAGELASDAMVGLVVASRGAPVDFDPESDYCRALVAAIEDGIEGTIFPLSAAPEAAYGYLLSACVDDDHPQAVLYTYGSPATAIMVLAEEGSDDEDEEESSSDDE
jgi:hypothetical protein